MQVSCPNNVKIYNLSAGKSLPEVNLFIFIVLNISSYNYILIFIISSFNFFQWLSERKRRALLKKNIGKLHKCFIKCSK